MVAANPILVLSSDDEVPEVIVLQVEHSFEGEGEEEKKGSSSAIDMPLKLLKIGVKSGQEKEPVSYPAVEVESSCPTGRFQKENDKGKGQDIGPS